MNLKNIFFCMFMMSMSLTSNVVLAGVPTNMLEGVDEVAALSAGGLLGFGVVGTLGLVKGGVLWGALGCAVGGPAGAALGWTGYVVFKAFNDKLKK